MKISNNIQLSFYSIRGNSQPLISLNFHIIKHFPYVYSHDNFTFQPWAERAGWEGRRTSAPERAEQTYVLLDKLTKHRYTKAEIPGCAH